MLEDLARQLLTRLGIRGVSTVALLVLVAVALYAHKAARMGGTFVTVGSTVTHDAKVVALMLAVLLLAGVVSADVERSRELIAMGRRQLDLQAFVDQLRRWVT